MTRELRWHPFQGEWDDEPRWLPPELTPQTWC
jgi:hypothetical protein